MENGSPGANIRQLVDAIDRVVPFVKAGGWDPVGLQVGDPAQPVDRIGVCHEATSAVIDEALARRIDLLVSYHPLLFSPTTRVVAGPSPSGRAHRLASSSIGLVVVHTAYDVAPGGVADSLAEALGLVDPEAFGPNYGPDSVKIVTFAPDGVAQSIIDAMAAHGAGQIGQYTKAAYRSSGEGSFAASDVASPAIGTSGGASSVAETRIEMVAPAGAVDRIVAAIAAAHPYEEPPFDIFEHRGNAGFIGRRGRLAQSPTLAAFAETVSDRLDAQVRVAGPRNRTVETVAVIPGSGRNFLVAAGAQDVVVTGDIGHHDARAAVARGQAIVDPGHAAGERPGTAKLYSLIERIAAALGSVVVDDLTAIDPDPWSDTWRR